MNQKAATRLRDVLTWLAVCLLVLVIVAAQAAQAQSFPDLTGRVVDEAQLLDAQTESALSARLAAHEAETSNQIVVATIPSLDGYEIADYANRLGRTWQLGTAENNNGVLLVVAPNDRKVRIEVGYGLEGALTDALSSIIIQREILPAFRKDDYADGINNGVNAVIKAIAGEYSAPPTGGTSNRGDDPFAGTLGNFLPLIFIAMVAATEVLRRSGKRKAANSAFPSGFAGLFGTIATGSLLVGLAIAVAVFLLIYFKGSGGSGGSSSGRHGGYIGTGGFGGGGFGGGGFGGGGGSFGGGGASGSW